MEAQQAERAPKSPGELRALAEAVASLPEHERVQFLGYCSDHFCTKCGSTKDGRTCWGCYESTGYD